VGMKNIELHRHCTAISASRTGLLEKRLIGGYFRGKGRDGRAA
jgi:hypothetical protein